MTGEQSWAGVGAALAVGEGGWLLIEMMSSSSSNGTGGTETLEPRSRPPCPEAQEGEKSLWDSPPELTELGINLPKGSPLHLESEIQRSIQGEIEERGRGKGQLNDG